MKKTAFLVLAAALALVSSTALAGNNWNGNGWNGNNWNGASWGGGVTVEGVALVDGQLIRR